jgi:hypothetical protein
VSDQRPIAEAGVAQLDVAQDALRKVQAQAAALAEVSEQLSLSVHVLGVEISALAEQLRAGASETLQVPVETPTRSDDLDGARLVALNMALNGDSRQDTGRYLAENFEIAEPERLLDEVYAAIEG